MDTLSIVGAREGNLRDVSLNLPKNKLIVFTGLSGSGKSTLLIDVLFNECQRLYLEALSLQGIPKPAVERVRGASPAIAILQNDANKNPRSTVGTVTDLFTALRMVYEKLGVYPCPHCGTTICAADCVEETERVGDDFHVYQYCSACGKRMNKLTRTDFSFNTHEGACPTCQGMGEQLEVNRATVVDEAKALEDGAVAFWVQKYGEYMIESLHAAYRRYGIPIPARVPVAELSDLQRAVLYDGVESTVLREASPHIKPPKTVASGRFEGIVPTLMRRLAEQGVDAKSVRPYFVSAPCPACKGERLGAASRAVTVEGTRLPELATITLRELLSWMRTLDANLDEKHRALVKDYLLDINTKLSRIAAVGLDHLTLDRTTVTLSGGELQRLRLSAILDSELTGIIYILDEPTAGLHPKDTAGLIRILQRLRDLGNTVLVIEHDPDVMQAADHLVDIGPGAGKHGGQVVSKGSLVDIITTPNSATGRFLSQKPTLNPAPRIPQATPIKVRNATKFNLRHLDVDIPTGCLTTVTGPSGSGKSTLVFEVLTQGDTAGCEQFDRMVEVGQSPVTRMKRSNVATYTDLYTEIRNLYARTDAAKTLGLTAKSFSFNTAGGRCETCEGMGTVTNNLLFFTDTTTPCPTCHGRRFHDDVLSVLFEGRSIVDTLSLSVQEAADAFQGYPKITRTLDLLTDVGLDYVELGQSLTTLSGGEAQRLKLAKELLGGRGKRALYLLDEPTSGLHPQDVEHFLVLLNRLVDDGNTVVVVEHNQQVVCASDWVIDLGPEGGDRGGQVLFEGTPANLATHGTSATANCLRTELAR